MGSTWVVVATVNALYRNFKFGVLLSEVARSVIISSGSLVFVVTSSLLLMNGGCQCVKRAGAGHLVGCVLYDLERPGRDRFSAETLLNCSL